MPSSRKPVILVLAGGISHERDVSLRSGSRVAGALAAAGAEVEQAEPDARLLDRVLEHRPDVIWPALHGASGEDGALRDILSLAGIPFVGSAGGPTRLAWNKPVAKTIVSSAGVHTPLSVTLPRESFRELDAHSVIRYLGGMLALPLVVKPAQGGSAMGVTIVETASQLPQALVDAYTYCDVAVIEQCIHGTEVAVSILDVGEGPTVLPIVEIVPVSGVYSFEARYNAGETAFFCPARLDDDTLSTVSAAALTAHRSLGLSQLSRVDFIIDESGVPWFLEANVVPGLTETSLMPMSIAAAGFDAGDVYLQLAESAIPIV